jgi:hypothetical protein
MANAPLAFSNQSELLGRRWFLRFALVKGEKNMNGKTTITGLMVGIAATGLGMLASLISLIRGWAGNDGTSESAMGFAVCLVFFIMLIVMQKKRSEKDGDKKEQ